MPDSKSSRQARRSVGLSLLGNGLAGTAGTVAAIYAVNTPSPVIGFVRLAIGAITSLICLAQCWRSRSWRRCRIDTSRSRFQKCYGSTFDFTADC